MKENINTMLMQGIFTFIFILGMAYRHGLQQNANINAKKYLYEKKTHKYSYALESAIYTIQRHMFWNIYAKDEDEGMSMTIQPNIFLF